MVLGFLSGILGGFGISTVLEPVQTRAQRALNKIDPVQLLNLGAYADAYRYNLISKDAFFALGNELGFSNKQCAIMFENTKDWLSKEDASLRRIANSINSVLEYYADNPTDKYPTSRLDEIKEEYCRNMYSIGYDKSESAKVFEALRPVPSFSILLDWLAKEVFEPEIRKKFKLDEDYPRIWDSLMESLGVPEFERKAYWAAHWNHPALGQIGNMYTRFRSDRNNRSAEDAAGAGVSVSDLEMTKEDYTEALKLHEIAPFWRDRIIANSFRPLPLTTIQQIAQYGLENRDWLKGRLEDYGYSAGNADKILDTWAIKYPPTSRSPFATNIVKRYERGVISRVQCVNLFKTEGLDQDTAEFITKLADDKRTLETEKMLINGLKTQYRRNNMTSGDLLTEVKKKVKDSGRANRIVEIITAGEAGFFTRFRLRDISRGLQEGSLTEEEARNAYESLRTQDSDIDILIRLYTKSDQNQ